MRYRAHRDPDPAPPVTPGFERVPRVWDWEYLRWSAQIQPGELFVTRHDESISAILRSCIAVCIRDPVLRVGGMTVFILPTPPGQPNGDPSSAAAAAALRHGRLEMEKIIDEVTKLGADPTRLRAKMFGGGRSLSGVSDAGAKTVIFVRRFLREQRLPLTAEQIGDSYPRRVTYVPSSGMAVVKRLPRRYAATVAAREIQYLSSLTHLTNSP